MNRVVITGLGFVSSLGLDVKSTWSAMLEGRSGIGPLRHFSPNREAVQIAAEVELPPAPDSGKHTSRCERLALLALEEALAQAGLELDSGDPRRRGVFHGSTAAGMPAAEAYLLARQDGRRGRATEPLYQHCCILADRVAERIQSLGPRSTIMNACSSSLTALGQAWERIALGELDFAVAGGSDVLSHTTFGGFSCLKALDPNPCRPFSRDRAGLNLGEGAVHFVLESLDSAQTRGAEILGEVLGYGASSDAHHPTAPHPEGLGAARAMEMALRCARLFPEDIDLVSAHATATPANDGAECLGIRRVLGDAAGRVSVTSSKSQFGHTLGAAGAVAAAVALLALRDQVVSPTLRLEDLDPVCDLDCTPKIAKERRLRSALVNAFAFGGNNMSLVLRRWA